MNIVAKEKLNDLQAYQAGRDLPTGIKLSSNENPLGPSSMAQAQMAAQGATVNRYPDGSASALRDSLAGKYGLEPSMITIGNGSDELLSLIATAYLTPADEVLVPAITFSVYETTAIIAGAKVIKIALQDNRLDLVAIARCTSPRTKIIYLCNPNNPTGTIFSQPEWQSLIEAVSADTLIVVDEAYAEYVNDREYPDTIATVKKGASNILVLRTFSKIYGLAGLRIGYAMGAQSLIENINKVRLPFNTNAVAQKAAIAALSDHNHYQQSLLNNSRGKEFLYLELTALGLKWQKTEANFIYMEWDKEAWPIYESLLAKGVALRPLASFGRPKALRVTIGTPEQNSFFVEKLREVL